MTARLQAAGATALLALIALVATPAASQQVAALDTAFISHVGQMARQRAAQLAAPPAQPENARVAQQYRDALADLERGAFTDASTMLQAVLQRAPQNPLYRGDFAYALLRAGRAEDAVTEYTRAYQGQQQNGWYILGIACAHAAQRQFADAAGAADLAEQTDSSVADGMVATSAAGWFEAAGDRTRALAWARLGVRKTPDTAINWLRVASYLMVRNDTTPEGIAAIRRYRALRADDKLGSAVYANYLFVAGQDDSAMALAESAAQDSAYRPFAAQMFLQAGRTLLVRRDVDRALLILSRGQAWADSSQRASYTLFIGRGQLLKVAAAFNDYEARHTCDLAHAADSLTTAAERNLRAGISADSARTQGLLDQVLPQYKANAQAALHSCQNAAAGQQPQRPAPRPAPRPRP